MLGGLALGLLTTAVSVNTGFGFDAMRAGPWTAWPRIGGPDIDPYARAVVARSGEAPIGRDQGIAFLAQEDSSGAALDGRCDYRISGPLPAARYWTIGLADPSGALLANPTGRYAFTSVELLRHDGGGFEIVISREARPGNWLSTGEGRNFTLALRLYDAALDIESHPDAAAFPKIEKLDCA